jgi:hypothetical protein
MFMLNSTSATYIVAVIFTILVGMLLLSFRDTIRGFREFFDFSVFRRFRRSVRHFRPRFSMKTLLVAAVALPPVIAYTYHQYRQGELNAQWLIPVAAYAAIVVFPLIYLFFADAFGPGPRRRWKKHLPTAPRKIHVAKVR